MPHSIFVGITETGKTTLARYQARKFRKLGHTVVVHDPVQTQTVGGGWGDGSIIYDDFDSMLDALDNFKHGKAHVFIDEAGDYFGVGDRDRQWILTRGRHMGYNVNLIAQRPKMIAPNVRNQATFGYIFRISPDDLDDIGQDFGHSGLGKTLIDQGEFLVLTTYTPKIERGTLNGLGMPLTNQPKESQI